MLTGTETLLAYDTTITFTNKPTNLIFYSNSDKTEAIVVENERYLYLNGFFSLDDNKKRDIPIYWEWKLESGVTQEEIDANDIIDSEFMGKTMSMQIATTGKQVTENPTGKYAVTFDTNGGTLPSYGNTSQATKQVTYGEGYGDLPIPTRVGYRFLGWNGKNLINIQNQNTIITNYYYKDVTSSPKYVLKPDTTYTLSFDYIINSATKSVGVGIGYGSDGYTRDIKGIDFYSGFGKKVVTFTTPDSLVYAPPYVWFRFVRMPSPGDANVDISNIQFEEGDVATLYEPYYVTSATQVTQNQNHTLTAIWEPTSN